MYLDFPELGAYPHFLQGQGMVLRVLASAMYLPRGSTGTDHAYLSRAYRTLNPPTNDHMCIERSGTVFSAIVLPNDPTVTGVPGASFGTPVLFGVP